MNMRIFFTILILTLSFQSWTKADDIRDFEIEGISVGDSLLDYYTEIEIINSEKTIYPGSKNFYTLHFSVDSKNYDQISIGVKNDDKNYIVYSIAGDKLYKQNPKNCLPKMKSIIEQFDNDLKSSPKNQYKHTYDTLAKGKSFAEVVDYSFPNNSAIRVWCNFFTEEVIKKYDVANGLSVSLGTNKWFNFLNNDAY